MKAMLQEILLDDFGDAALYCIRDNEPTSYMEGFAEKLFRRKGKESVCERWQALMYSDVDESGRHVPVAWIVHWTDGDMRTGHEVSRIRIGYDSKSGWWRERAALLDEGDEAFLDMASEVAYEWNQRLDIEGLGGK